MSENQPLYQELFTLLSKRQETELLHSQALSDLAFTFRDTIHKQLGFPQETFLLPANEAAAGASVTTEPQSEPWVRLYEFTDGQMQPASGPVLSTIREDGSLSFAIGVTLSAELESFPKFHFWAAYLLSKRNPTETPVLRTLSGKPREYRIINNDFSKAVDDYVSDIKVALDPNSIYSVATKSDCMGFFCNT